MPLWCVRTLTSRPTVCPWLGCGGLILRPWFARPSVAMLWPSVAMLWPCCGANLRPWCARSSAANLRPWWLAGGWWLVAGCCWPLLAAAAAAVAAAVLPMHTRCTVLSSGVLLGCCCAGVLVCGWLLFAPPIRKLSILHAKKFFCPAIQQCQNGRTTISPPSRLTSALHQQ